MNANNRIAIFVVAVFIFFNSNSLVRAENNKQSEGSNLKGVFQEFKWDPAVSPKGTAIIWLFDFKDGKRTNLFEFDNQSGHIPVVMKNNRLLYTVNDVTYLAELPDTNAKETKGLAGGIFVSSKGQEYVLYQSGEMYYTYAITSGNKEIFGHLTAYEEPAWLLGSDSLLSKIFYVQFGALHELRKGGGIEVLHQDKKATSSPRSELFINYRALSKDSTKVLITKTTIQGIILEAGIFEIPKRKYRSLASDVNQLLESSTMVGFTEDSLSLQGAYHEGYGVYSYWNLDPVTDKRTTLFKSSDGVIVSRSPDGVHFLIRKEVYTHDGPSKCSYFVEPSENLASSSKISTERTDGYSACVSFLGWLSY